MTHRRSSGRPGLGIAIERSTENAGGLPRSKEPASASAKGNALELGLLGGPVGCGGRGGAVGDDLPHLMEVAGADLALVARRGVALRLGGGLRGLQPGVGR